MVLLTEIILVTHPIDHHRHPTVPPGWRWAVMAGTLDYEDMGRCANAGWCPTRQEAQMEGEMVAVTAVKAARMFGLALGYRSVELDHDPILADADMLGTPA
jgi:hypothetical protein